MFIRFMIFIFLFSGCMAKETMRVVQTSKPLISNTTPIGQSISVSIGNFNNKSSYQKGIFSDGIDRLGSQAQTTLIAHLNLSNRFSVLDRSNTESSKQEAEINKQKQLVNIFSVRNVWSDIFVTNQASSNKIPSVSHNS